MVRVLLLAVLVGCGAAQSSHDHERTEHTELETTCAGFVEQYRTALASASGMCATEADCGIYGGLDAEDICGGVTDRETGNHLTEIGDASDEAGCARPGYSCPELVIECRDGMCDANDGSDRSGT